MTIDEMVRSLVIQSDKVNSLSTADFQPEHYKFYLDLAVNQFVINAYTGNNLHRAAFETSEESISALSMLVTIPTDFIMPTSTSSTQTAVNIVPTDFWFFVRLSAVGTGCKSRFVYVQHDDLEALLVDPFNKPKAGKVLYTVVGRDLRFYKESSTQLGALSYVYIRKPVSMLESLTPTEEYTDIHSVFHPKIVLLALSMMLEGTENPRYNSLQNQLNKLD